ncbi:MAG: methyl-accepting chemotaxis protein, partial [Bradyrhizobium sp.]
MLNRLTVSSLIQSVIVLMSACMVALLCFTAWDSWQRLTTTSRISVVADASSSLFKAMHNLRSDRSTTVRSLNDDAVLQPNIEKYLRDTRDAQMPAMRSAVEVLGSVDFADHATLVPELTRLVQSMTALEAESWDAMQKPKASRRPTLGKEFLDVTAALLDTMDKISVRIAASVNHSDPVIDQLLMIKQLAWLMRNTAGEASLLISNSLAAGHAAPEVRQNYTKLVGGIEIAWTALQTVAAGSALP